MTKTCPKCNSSHEKPGIFCSRSCSSSRNHSLETREKIRTKVKENYVLPSKADMSKGGKNRWKPSERICNRPLLTCQECNEQFIDDSCATRTRKYCSRTCSNKHSYHPNSTRVHRTIYKGFQLDSGAELYFCQLLDKFNIRWFKNTNIRFHYDINNVNKYYVPDFYLPDYQIWIEIKGKRYIRNNDNIRQASCPNLLLIMSEELKSKNIIQHILYFAHTR
jgi:hypothetical protein